MPRRRTSARWAAPAALVASAVAVFLVVRGGTADDAARGPRSPAGDAPATTARTTPPAAGRTMTTPAAADGPATYTVQAGDTLSAIAAETGVAVDELQRLNPDIDPSSLRVGEQLELRDE